MNRYRRVAIYAAMIGLGIQLMALGLHVQHPLIGYVFGYLLGTAATLWLLAPTAPADA